jgi:Protein of unknown function, DUF547
MRRKILWLLGSVLGLLLVGTLIAHALRPRVQIGGPAAGERVSLGQVDHGPLDALLQKYVDDHGLVAYRKWKADASAVRALDDYLAQLGTVDLSQPAPRQAELAYWINAYNALTLKGILLKYPTRSIKEHTPVLGGYNIWRDLLLWVDGTSYSLNNIEHDILRKKGEPRIHFALVCASRGCPPLRRRAYTADHLDQELSANARKFFARPANFQTDEAEHSVKVSQLFSWYGEDFAASPRGIIQALRPYFPNGDKIPWLNDSDVALDYLEYDWSLNDQEPVAGS